MRGAQSRRKASLSPWPVRPLETCILSLPRGVSAALMTGLTPGTSPATTCAGFDPCSESTAPMSTALEEAGRALFLPACVLSCFRPHGLQPSRLCPWASPVKSTGVGCHALLQGIFPTQGSNLYLPVSCVAGRFFTSEPLGKLLFYFPPSQFRC